MDAKHEPAHQGGGGFSSGHDEVRRADRQHIPSSPARGGTDIFGPSAPRLVAPADDDEKARLTKEEEKKVRERRSIRWISDSTLTLTLTLNMAPTVTLGLSLTSP